MALLLGDLPGEENWPVGDRGDNWCVGEIVGGNDQLASGDSSSSIDGMPKATRGTHKKKLVNNVQVPCHAKRNKNTWFRAQNNVFIFVVFVVVIL